MENVLKPARFDDLSLIKQQRNTKSKTWQRKRRRSTTN